MSVETLFVRQSGLRDWQPVSDAMHHYTDQRDDQSRDEIWLVEHPPVFTQGQAGKAEHLLMPGDIPVVQSDRGGQVTYHGPGQQVMYVLIDVKRRKLGVRQLVTILEETVIATLAEFGVSARARADAPGVYVGEEKICSLGLRIRKGCSFHGLALNVAMDLSPFLRINPCGYAGMSMTQLKHFQPDVTTEQVRSPLVSAFARLSGYENVEWIAGDLPVKR
ncbi:lipoyl(octanoyl) transferase LipB [Pantoea sp. Bo_2]|uniref:Octanoyltransferase n=1 Tax=Candidatus Pantoea gossypiicola TaxID=2608008 RepID=A0AB34CNL9_9GAMM|nr:MULTISPECIES: lipoyl(octanoyl) transferase LipB [Pantoea]KAA5932274.1 lipoyl(octanoyl) transferase LipB [Pantoea sp. VH_8]KAA5937335.1 lipoyl(octanoyl) transferase LipB [Pantoea sp. VH_4]KAA5947028.1 lipoyl(octanoyl) transferase LipB [Pantoea sp. VH_3]KAA5951489.1 lipoyl(octanoyl) transferase LipB [Pantoea sp. VH_24]KAA5952159.1 lipoyl(octanoyl) transferase LipB [Pantoea sp. VH_25]